MTFITPPKFLWSDVIGTAESKTSLVSKLNILADDLTDLSTKLPPVPISIPLPLSQGGSGATDAASARTAFGLNSMAIQSASAVAITGGAIDGTVIGGSVQAAGSFAAINGSGNLKLTNASRPNLIVDDTGGSPGVRGRVSWFVNGVTAAEITMDDSSGQLKFFQGGTSRLRLNMTTGQLQITGEANVLGDINHDGSNAGFFGVTPAARPSAYTQTYNTATKTHNAPTATALTAASGTSDGTVADVGASFNQATLNNNFQDLVTAYNNLRNDVLNIKQVVNSVIDDDQILGLKQ